MNRRNFIKVAFLASLGVPSWAATLVNRNDDSISEWDKCKISPKYFINNYIYIPHPTRGKTLFHTYPYQDLLLKDYYLYNRNVVVKSRQIGISSLSLAYALWDMIFSDRESNILFVTPTQGMVDTLGSKISFMYHNLPEWMKDTLLTDNRDSFMMQNGAKFTIKSARRVELYVRGNSLSMLVADETAFCDDMLDVWLSAWPAMREDSKVIFTSSLNEVGDWFHDLAKNRKLVGAKYTVLPWHLHPERDYTWKNETEKMIGKKNFARDYECRFIA